jgi:Putative addiction module component
MAVGLEPDEEWEKAWAAEIAASARRSTGGRSDEEWEKAWAAEIERRMKEVDEGRARLIPHEEVFAELRARFPPR